QQPPPIAQCDVIARVESERAVVACDRFLRAPEIGQDAASSGMRRRRLRSQSKRTVEAFQSKRIAAQSRLEQSTIEMSFDEARVHLRCAVELHERLFLAIGALECRGEIVEEARILRLQLHRSRERLNGLRHLAEAQEAQAAAVVSRREVGLQRYGAPVGCERIGMTAPRVERVAEVGEQYRIPRLQSRGARERIDRLRRAVEPPQGKTEKMQHIAVARIGGEEFSITFNGLRQPTLLVQGMCSAQYVVAAHC